jgi:Family of unknown function (DUF6090)
MIKFFRKIRQKMLAENKFTKYLLYAIGEIFLVMIGILLALQVNNWNELRKKDHLEINILKELKNNLENDQIDINENIEWHTKSIYSSQLITKIIDDKIPYNDSLDYHFSSILIFPMFLPTRTAYESLNNHGARLIKNDSLRFSIIGLYERAHVFLTDVMNGERQQTFNDLHNLYRKEFNSFDWFGKTHPADFNRLVKNEEYYNYLQYKIAISKFMLDLYFMLTEDIEILSKLIDEELELRN